MGKAQEHTWHVVKQNSTVNGQYLGPASELK